MVCGAEINDEVLRKHRKKTADPLGSAVLLEEGKQISAC